MAMRIKCDSYCKMYTVLYKHDPTMKYQVAREKKLDEI